MKALSISFLMSILSLIAHAQCNHRLGFEKSAVADTVDAIHYHIQIDSINFTAKTIKAHTLVRLHPKVATAVIPLELKALQATAVSIDQQAVAWIQSGDILRIFAAQTIQPSDTIQVEVAYQGQPFHEGWGGFHFSGNYAFNLGVGFESDPHNLGKAWFPCVDDFQDRATYALSVRLPAEMTGIGGGLLTDTIHHANGEITWHWQIHQPIPTYLASVAVGPYSSYTDEYQGIENNLPITIYTRPIDTNKVEGSFEHLHQIAAIFESRYGSYPFDRIGYTGTAIGAMEHVTNIAYPHFAINGNLNSEYLLAHELSHMWFGNKVTCADAGDMWLNEGWATFCQMFYKHDLYGPEVYRNEMNANHLDVLKNAHITDGSYLSLHNVPTAYTYGTTVYDKGATVVHTLMNYLGQDLFFDAVKAYLQQYAFQHASSTNMMEFLTEYTGRPMQPFFDTWVFTPGTPHFGLDSVVITPQGNQYQADIHIKQRHKGGQHIASNNILELGFLDENWQIHTDTVHFDGPLAICTKALDFEPLLVLADPYDKTADATTDLSGILRETGEVSMASINFRLYVDALTDSAYYRMTHHWVAPDSLQNPVSGLRLSPYRHWEMAGVFPEGTQMRGRFFYSNTNTLDGSLITSEQDSVVMVYRPSAAQDWSVLPQTREGFWNIGYIIIDDFLPGQYTLAVLDTQLVGLKADTKPQATLIIKAEPNPASQSITLSWNAAENMSVNVVDSTGKIVFNQDRIGGQRLSINLQNWAKGWYYSELRNEKGLLSGFTKFIVQ